jgi:hypothetical protein
MTAMGSITSATLYENNVRVKVRIRKGAWVRVKVRKPVKE